MCCCKQLGTQIIRQCTTPPLVIASYNLQPLFSNPKLQQFLPQFATIFLKSQALAILATICNYFSQIQALAIPNFPTKKVIFKLFIRCSLQGFFFLSLLWVCRSENECIGVSTWNLGAIESCAFFFLFLFCCVQSYALQHMLQFKLEGQLIINGGLTWEGFVRCLMSFGVDGVGIFQGI